MRKGRMMFRVLAAGTLAAAVLLTWSTTAQAQGGAGISTSGGGGYGGGGGGGGMSSGGSSSSGSSSSSGFSFAGGNNFVGSTSGSSGSSFAGSSGSGGSFSGSSGGLFSGTSGTGSYGGGSGGGRGSQSLGGVSQYNMLASSFANPLAAGLGSGASNAAFGTPLITGSLVSTPTNMLTNTSTLISSTSGSANVRGGSMSSLGGGGGLGSTNSQTGPNFGAMALVLPNALAMANRPGGTGPVIGLNSGSGFAALAPNVQTDLQGLLARSDRISAASRNGLTMGVDSSGTLVLRGEAASPADAHMIETILKYAPGVYGLRNEMTWKSPSAGQRLRVRRDGAGSPIIMGSPLRPVLFCEARAPHGHPIPPGRPVPLGTGSRKHRCQKARICKRPPDFPGFLHFPLHQLPLKNPGSGCSRV